MPTVDVKDSTYDRLRFAARVAGISISELIDRLTLSSDPAPSAGPASPAEAVPRTGEVEVYVVYRGERVDGLLDLETERLRITRGPERLAGRSFKSPTQAAVETVKVVNPGRERPETNGWRFWRDAASDRIIDQLRSH
jgi:hypothetical protein